MGLALGYGKKDSGKSSRSGVNAYPLFDGYNTIVSGVTIEKQMLMTTNLQNAASKYTDGTLRNRKRGFSRYLSKTNNGINH